MSQIPTNRPGFFSPQLQRMHSTPQLQTAAPAGGAGAPAATGGTSTAQQTSYASANRNQYSTTPYSGSGRSAASNAAARNWGKSMADELLGAPGGPPGRMAQQNTFDAWMNNPERKDLADKLMKPHDYPISQMPENLQGTLRDLQGLNHQLESVAQRMETLTSQGRMGTAEFDRLIQQAGELETKIGDKNEEFNTNATRLLHDRFPRPSDPSQTPPPGTYPYGDRNQAAADMKEGKNLPPALQGQFNELQGLNNQLESIGQKMEQLTAQGRMGSAEFDRLIQQAGDLEGKIAGKQQQFNQGVNQATEQQFGAPPQRMSMDSAYDTRLAQIDRGENLPPAMQAQYQGIINLQGQLESVAQQMEQLTAQGKMSSPEFDRLIQQAGNIEEQLRTTRADFKAGADQLMQAEGVPRGYAATRAIDQDPAKARPAYNGQVAEMLNSRNSVEQKYGPAIGAGYGMWRQAEIDSTFPRQALRNEAEAQWKNEAGRLAEQLRAQGRPEDQIRSAVSGFLEQKAASYREPSEDAVQAFSDRKRQEAAQLGELVNLAVQKQSESGKKGGLNMHQLMNPDDYDKNGKLKDEAKEGSFIY